MKKFIAVIILSAMVLTIMVSCGDDKQNTEKPGENNADIPAGETDQNQSGGADAANERIEPELPEKDFEGYEFTFYAHKIDYAGDWVGDGDPREIVSDEETGDPIEDSVYRRNRAIEGKYNINIKMITSSDNVGALRRVVNAGDSIYDAAVIFNNNVPGVVTNNLLVNVDHLPYIDLSRPWWDPAVKSMSIANQNYLMAGDLLILDNEATSALLFNKDLMGNFGIELPYKLVNEGKWTMDAMNEIIKDTAEDLDGNGVMGPEDRWGFVVGTDTLHSLFVSGGGALAIKDNDDIPFINFTSPRNLAVIEKAMDLMYNPEYVVNVHNRTEYSPNAMFEENRVLFFWMRMRVVEFFRGMESNFGIVPMPKYEETQENYYSVVNPYTGVMLGIPKSAEDLDRVSIIIEALSAESRYTLQPAYYDLALQRKYVRDDESGEMLDIIFNSRVYDIGSVYSFGNVFLDFIELSRNQNRNVMSYYESRITRMESDIEKVVKNFTEME